MKSCPTSWLTSRLRTTWLPSTFKAIADYEVEARGHPFGPALRFQATVLPSPQEGLSTPNRAPGHPPTPDCGVLEARSVITPGLAGLAKCFLGRSKGGRRKLGLWYAGGKTTGAPALRCYRPERV